MAQVATLDGGVITEFYWSSVAGSGELNFVAQQIGNRILFYRVGTEDALSQGFFDQTLNLDGLRIPGSPSTRTIGCQFASGYGYLFIAHPYCNPIYVTYNVAANLFIFQNINIEIRDFTGTIESPVNPVGLRPVTLSESHHYNLINQGWFCQATQWSDGTGDFETLGLVDGYINLFYSQLGQVGGGSVYPSNSDVWYLYKAANGGFSPYTTLSTIGSYNSIAPKGYFIMDAFNQDRNALFNAAAQGVNSDIRITTLPVINAGYQRPSAIAFYSGRVFYAGVQAQGFSNQIYYSQIVQDPSYLSKCYQQNDPTASDTGVADLVDSDGGVLIFPEIGQVYRLFPIAYSLIVFASNGVWAISGSTGSGFKATDFSISKISSVGMFSGQAFIDLDGSPVWWNLDGIYTLAGNNPLSPNAGAGTSSINITDPVIKTFIDLIPAGAKKFSKGSYNRGLYTIYWLYSRDEPITIDDRYHYTNVLCFNTNTRAFYDWELPHGDSEASGFTDMWVSGIVTVQGAGTSFELVDVTDNLFVTVTDQEGNNVQVLAQITTEHQSVTKFLIQYVDADGITQITYAEVNSPLYKDFIDLDYSSYFTSGYALDGQGIAKFQSPYIIIYANDEETNGFNLSSIWDFATDLTVYTNKTGTQQTFLSEGGSHAWNSYRRKMRGVGRAMQVKVSSVSGLPFEIAGWAIEVSTNSGP